MFKPKRLTHFGPWMAYCLGRGNISKLSTGWQIQMSAGSTGGV